MRRILMVILLAGTFGGQAARADEVAVQGVIDAQIAAFLRDDFASAFTHASPMIKRMFRTPERFGAMVRQGYPMIWRPGSVRYLEQTEVDGRLHQKVMITDRAGVVSLFDYEMLETPDGWQINGVAEIPLPDVGV